MTHCFALETETSMMGKKIMLSDGFYERKECFFLFEENTNEIWMSWSESRMFKRRFEQKM